MRLFLRNAPARAWCRNICCRTTLLCSPTYSNTWRWNGVAARYTIRPTFVSCSIFQHLSRFAFGVPPNFHLPIKTTGPALVPVTLRFGIEQLDHFPADIRAEIAGV